MTERLGGCFCIWKCWISHTYFSHYSQRLPTVCTWCKSPLGHPAVSPSSTSYSYRSLWNLCFHRACPFLAKLFCSRLALVGFWSGSHPFGCLVMYKFVHLAFLLLPVALFCGVPHTLHKHVPVVWSVCFQCFGGSCDCWVRHTPLHTTRPTFLFMSTVRFLHVLERIGLFLVWDGFPFKLAWVKHPFSVLSHTNLQIVFL